MGEIIVIGWIVIMVFAAIIRRAENRKKKQTILDQQYREALERQQQYDHRRQGPH